MRIFNSLVEEIQSVLLELENKDEEERKNDVDRKLRLRQIPRETGEFLFNLITLSISNSTNWEGLEIGGSGGYSTIWQGLAVKKSSKGKLISLEIDEKKIEIAKKYIHAVDLEDYVSVTHTDAKEYVKHTKIEFSYVFIDAEKEDYLYYFKTLKDKVKHGCIWICDNLISHANDMKEFTDYLDQESNIAYTILTIGKGLAFIVSQ